MQTHLMDVFQDANMGGDLGAFRMFHMIVGSLGPTYVGFTAERTSYTLAFVGVIGCLFVNTLIIGRLLWVETGS